MGRVYLPPNKAVCPVSITEWISEEGNLNLCMYELLCSTLLFCLVSMPLLSMLMAHAPSNPRRFPSTMGSKLKLLSHIVIILLLLARPIVLVVLNVHVYAYIVIQVGLDVAAWSVVTLLYVRSQKKQQRIIPTVFWFLSLGRLLGGLVDWNTDLWFFKRKTQSDKIEFIIYLGQIGCTLYICLHSLFSKCCKYNEDGDRELLIDAEETQPQQRRGRGGGQGGRGGGQGRGGGRGGGSQTESAEGRSGQAQGRGGSQAQGRGQAQGREGLPDVTYTPHVRGRPSHATQSTWSGMLSKCASILPMIWPTGQYVLQGFVFICIALLIISRVVNLILPLIYRDAVNELTKGKLALWTIVLYCSATLAQGTGMGSGGLLGTTRSQLWLSVTQHTAKKVNTRLFTHLHNLSIAWHMDRKTGEVMTVIDRSGSAITNLLNYVLFDIAPCLVDLVVAIAYFCVAFNIWYGLIIFVTMFYYMVSTLVLQEWRTKYRREMNQTLNETKAIAVDSLLNFEAVKYFGAETYESGRFARKLISYLKMEYMSTSSLSILSAVQNVLIYLGTLGGSVLIVYDVHAGRLTVGDFVLFVSYVRQLYQPLSMFGTYYRIIQNNFIDMEMMFDLLNKKVDVNDRPGAPELKMRGGRIVFDNVCFNYNPETLTLKNISFTVESGQKVALVGPSGHGKSTMMKLLFRFYDINSGLITIDNQDISEVTQASLRKAIGVVPQDTVLFNDTIRDNVRYGKVEATDEDVYAATRQAELHNAVSSFYEGYDTVVGERGLKLSGGEKQRVAIARTILKSPQIVLLDEATSSLDTKTERQIQSSLDKACEGKTSIIIAHRLSTVIHCDQILVLKNGEIAERGTHQQLLEMEGIYTDMWNQQISTDEENSESTTE